jgi:hypothetical protein
MTYLLRIETFGKRQPLVRNIRTNDERIAVSQAEKAVKKLWSLGHIITEVSLSHLLYHTKSSSGMTLKRAIESLSTEKRG